MGHVVITGSQSRLGLALRKQLEAAGKTVLGLDLPGKGADVEVDLSTADSRQHAIQRLVKHCGGLIEALVCSIDVHDAPDSEILGVNYFGTVDLLVGVRGSLARGREPAAVVNVSNASVITPGIPEQAVTALLEGDEGRALEVLKSNPARAFAASHLAVARWIRRHAPSPDWAGRGITLNGISTGPVVADLLTQTLENPLTGWWNLWASMLPAEFAGPFHVGQGSQSSAREMPRPRGHHPTPEQAAGLVEFLLGDKARFLVGQIIAVDGGIEATFRPDDWPSAMMER
jgi:NAD(P)-dependent dehydrogenase (short-subunit alcohol dehydrogenase family)